MKKDDVTGAAMLGVQAALGEYYRLSGTDPNTVLTTVELAALAAKSQEMWTHLIRGVKQ